VLAAGVEQLEEDVVEFAPLRFDRRRPEFGGTA